MSAHVLRVLGLDAPSIRRQIGETLADAETGDPSSGSGEWIEALGDRPR